MSPSDVDCRFRCIEKLCGISCTDSIFLFSCFRSRRRSSSASSSRSSSSDSDSERRVPRKQKRASSKDSDDLSQKRKTQAKAVSASKEDIRVLKDTIKSEQVKEETPAPPTRLRRKPLPALEKTENVSLKRNV